MFIFKLRHDKRGMTLIEMIISLVILSILMTSTMGMITSSMSIFTSTSMAAIDRMVGNSVYTTLESSLKYATHLTISDSPDSGLTSQSFYINVTDTATKSGNVYYRAAGDDYLSLYDSNYYKGRTIQYDVEEVGSDDKHVKLSVNIYREGEVVYTKTAVIKCVNLALLSNNGIDSSDSSPSSINQYLYFSVDEMLIAGGENAWSLEYKINEYMNRYNAILYEYYGKLVKAENPITDGLANNRNENGRRIYKETLDGLLNVRNVAVFGNGTTTVEWEGDSPSAWCNLRAHYQEEINDLLKFSPTHGIIDSASPYYKVVATKEELYTGFLLTYYDANNDGKITQSEYPNFSSDDNTFFAGTVLDSYDKNDGGIIGLCYFDDFLDGNYSSLWNRRTQTVYYYTGVGYVCDETVWHGVVSRLDNKTKTWFESGEYDSYAQISDVALSMPGGVTFSTNVGKWYKYNGDGSNTALGTFTTASYQVDSSYKNQAATHSDIVSRVGAQNIMEYAEDKTDLLQEITLDNGTNFLTKLVATRDVPEGWYYFKDLSGAYWYFYLEADVNAETDANGIQIAMKTSEQYPKYISLWATWSYNLTLYHYDQAYFATDEVAGQMTVDRYSYTLHQYKDWILYGVSWNSWFKPTQQGFLNGIIGGIANWFTGQSDISYINGVNADQSLGLKGKYNVSNLNSGLRSYNLAWMVYSPRRSTWYYLPDSTNRLNSALSGISWTSNKNKPVPLDCEAWGSSTKMINDIETRKLSDSMLFGLVDGTMDMIWVPLPTGGAIDRTDLIKGQ